MITNEMKKYARFVFTNIIGLYDVRYNLMMPLHMPNGKFVNVEEIEHIETINNYCAFKYKNNPAIVLIDNMGESDLKNYIKKYKELWHK